MHLDTGTMREVPVSMYTLERFAQILREHFQDPKNRSIIHFLDQYGVPKNTFKRWRERCELLDQECQIAKDKIGMQCLLDAAERKYDKDIGRFIAGLYSKDIRNHEAFLSALKNKNESSSDSKITLEIPELVKDKDKDNETS